MNITNLKKTIANQDKATSALVEKLLNLPKDVIESYPFITKKGGMLNFYSPFYYRLDTDYISPYVMNGNFSLELKLKYLYFLENSNKFENTHDLKKIYDHLSADSKTYMQNLLDQISKRELQKKIARYINQDLKINFRWKLDFLLEKSKLSFEKWRYIFDEQDPTWFVGYTEISEIINSRISLIENSRQC